MEGTGQSNYCGDNWGNGFATAPSIVNQAGVSDATPFFQAILTAPWLSQVSPAVLEFGVHNKLIASSSRNICPYSAAHLSALQTAVIVEPQVMSAACNRPVLHSALCHQGCRLR